MKRRSFLSVLALSLAGLIGAGKLAHAAPSIRDAGPSDPPDPSIRDGEQFMYDAGGQAVSSEEMRSVLDQVKCLRHVRIVESLCPDPNSEFHAVLFSPTAPAPLLGAILPEADGSTGELQYPGYKRMPITADTRTIEFPSHLYPESDLGTDLVTGFGIVNGDGVLVLYTPLVILVQYRHGERPVVNIREGVRERITEFIASRRRLAIA